MNAPTARHPYAYTLELLMLAINRLPPTFSEERRKEYQKSFELFLKQPNVSYEDIRRTIAEIGKESWPYRKAYEEMYARYGRASEESFLFEHLDQGVRDKYAQFLREGGKINYIGSVSVRSEEDMMRASPFERYFAPEEKFAIEQALLVARDSARLEINGLVTGKKTEEYDQLVRSYAAKQRQMEEKIDEMRHLAGVSKKWESEISDRIRTLEEGWSVVEKGADLPELERETEYWKGTLGSFLHA
ncbi:MAG TPA: hypothetical protein VL500_03030 [Candidatus Eisenbacteria bacterium]|jgi:hypothetical protein|nr:hypothetical protein [Candidatus Eisenbacteria bacterium]